MGRSRFFGVLNALTTRTEPSRPGWSPLSCRGSSSLSERSGSSYCCYPFASFLQLTNHVQKHALQKLSLILKLAILFFFYHHQACISWRFFSMKPWWTYPMLIIPPLLSHPYLSSGFPPPPNPITSMHTHQVHVHLLINGFKVLWCHIRDYISQLPL